MQDYNNNCPAFESYWNEYGVAVQPPILQEAMKEIAWKSWCTCADHGVRIAESWGNETPSILRMKLLPKK